MHIAMLLIKIVVRPFDAGRYWLHLQWQFLFNIISNCVASVDVLSEIFSHKTHPLFPQHGEEDTKSHSVAEGVYCPLTFDGLSCWNYTPAGETAFLPCPYFIAGFDTRRKCTARCCYKEPMTVHPGTSAGHVTCSIKQSVT